MAVPHCRHGLTPVPPLLPLILLLASVAGQGIADALAYTHKDPRLLLNFGNASQEDRSATLRALHADDYMCWMPPQQVPSAVCIKNRDSPDYLPETAKELRHILGRVNLRTWLSHLLCPEGERRSDGQSETEHSRSPSGCRELVDGALSMNTQDVSAPVSVSRISLTARSTLEEIPWVTAIETIEPYISTGDINPAESRFIVSVLATHRATQQLLPAIKTIKTTMVASASSASSTEPISARFAATTEKLLDLLDPDGSALLPSVRVEFPKRGGRVSGSVVPLVAEVNLGTALEARLAEDTTARDGASGRARGNGRQHSGGDDLMSGSSLPATETTAKIPPPLDRCELRIILDEEVTARFPVAPSGTTNMKEGVAPVYGPRCSEHPEQERTAAAGKEWWRTNKDGLYVEARTIDRVCSRNYFGPHRVRAELACYAREGGKGSSGEALAASSNVQKAVEERAGSADMAAPTPELTSPPVEIVATSASIEYIHTGNGATGVASLEGNKTAEVAVTQPLPEDVSAFLYLEGMPYTSATVTVPRWSCEGDVWQASLGVCSTAFSPEEAVIVEINDCVDLAMRTLEVKRVDLYHQTVDRLEAYLKESLPALEHRDIMGHTGRIPEKVEALAGVARNGGEHVKTVCEVGFNAGHSSLNWLMNSHPSSRVLAFDLAADSYVRHSVDFLQAMFPGRLDVIIGDSKETIPAYSHRERLAGRDPAVCNILFVDGDHTEEGAYADIVAFEALANRTWHTLIIDDIDLTSVAIAWNRFKGWAGGRLERVVQGRGQHSTRIKDPSETDGTREVIIDNWTHFLFLTAGHSKVGIGQYHLALDETSTA